jgi:hypothetical protein
MTEILMDGKRLEKLEIFVNEEYGFWLRGITVDGQRFETGTARGEI